MNEESDKLSSRASQRKRPRPNQHKRRSSIVLASGQVHITPWNHFGEFEAVGRALLSAGGVCLLPSPESIEAEAAEEEKNALTVPQRVWSYSVEQALERVEIWKLRSPQLPHAVEATHALAGCLWDDQRSSPPSSLTTSLRLSFAAAVIRCINGLTDALQQKRAAAASIAHLSSLLGIPGWLVDVRHQSTHNQLPSLSVLRTASVTLLQYLQQVYWVPTMQQRQERYQTARELLSEYAQVAENVWKAKRAERSGTGTTDTKEKRKREDILTKICDPTIYQGTSFNRFSVLMDERKSTSKLTSSAQPTGRDTNVKRKRESSSNARTLWSLAGAYTKHSDIPLDLLYKITQESLQKVAPSVANTAKTETEAPPRTCTVVPTSSDAAEPTLYRMYLPLLLTLTRHCPGAAAAVMSQFLHFALHNVGHDSAKDQTFVVKSQWMEYLLSDEWCNRRSNGTGGVSVTCSSLIPFRSLLDQCEKVNTDQARSIAQQLRKRLHESTQSYQTSNAMSHHDDESITERYDCAQELHLSNGHEAPDQPQVLTAMTLEEMESLIGNTGGKVGVGEGADSKPSVRDVSNTCPRETTSPVVCRPAWVRCDWWDECSIGMLPGQPYS